MMKRRLGLAKQHFIIFLSPDIAGDYCFVIVQVVLDVTV